MRKLNGKIFLFIGIAILVIVGGLVSLNLAQAQAVTTSTLGLGFGAGTGLGSTDIRVMIANIIRIALGLIGIILVIIVLYAGFLWLTAQGEEDKIKKAKSLLINGVIGLAIILASYAIAAYVLNKLVTATTGFDNGGNNNGGDNGNGGGLPAEVFQVRDIQPRGQLKIRNVVVRVTLSQPLAVNFFDGEGATKTPVIVEKIKVDGSGELVQGSLTTVQGNPRQVLFTPSTPCKNQQGEDLAIKCFAYDVEDPALPNPNLNHYRVTIDKTAGNIFVNNEGTAVTCLGKTCQAEFIVGDKVDELSPTVSWVEAVSLSNENQQAINLNNANVALLSQGAVYNLTIQSSDLTANADDIVSGIAGVDFYILDALTSEDSPSTTVDSFLTGFNFDTTPYQLKQVYDLKARAYDVAGNYSNFKIKQVQILANHCFNNAKDGDETAVDCGAEGGDCDVCPIDNVFRVKDIQPRGQLNIRNVVARISLNQIIFSELIGNNNLLKNQDSVIVERYNGQDEAGNDQWVRFNDGLLSLDPNNPRQILFTPNALCIDGKPAKCFENALNPVLNRYRVTINTAPEAVLKNDKGEAVVCDGIACQAEFTVGAGLDGIAPVISELQAVNKANNKIVNLNDNNKISLAQNSLYDLKVTAKDIDAPLPDVSSGVVGTDFYFDNVFKDSVLSAPTVLLMSSFLLDTNDLKNQPYVAQVKAYDAAGNEVSKVKQVNILPEHCFNEQLDEDETGVDCGGSCDVCLAGGDNGGGQGGNDNNNETVNNYFEWQFTTCLNCLSPAVVENSSCVVENVSPAPFKNSENNFIDSVISATFNTDMNDDSFKLNQTVKIFQCGNGGFNINQCIATAKNGSFVFGQSGSGYEYFNLTLDNPLENGYWYDVVLTTGLESAEKLSLPENYSWYFKVGDQQAVCDAVKVNPANRLNNPANPNDQPVILGDEVWYRSSAYNKANCNICPDKFTWQWRSSAPNQATIDEQSTLAKSLLTAGALTDKTATITASIIENNQPAYSGVGKVDIVAPSPNVVFDNVCEGNLTSPSPYLNSRTACPNGFIRARFSTVMDESLLNDGALTIAQVLGDNKFQDIALEKLQPLYGQDNYKKQGLIGVEARPKENLPSSAHVLVSLSANVKNTYNRFLIGKRQWDFYTAKENCAADSVTVNPDFIQLPFETAQDYSASVFNSQVCQALRPDNGNWLWQVRDESIAELASQDKATAKVLTQKQNGLTRVIAAVDGISNEANGSNGRLQVGKDVWQISGHFPTGDDVCQNSFGELLFNLPLLAGQDWQTKINVFSGVGLAQAKWLLTINPLLNNNGLVFSPRGDWPVDNKIKVVIKGGPDGLLSFDNQQITSENCLAQDGLNWDQNSATCSWQFIAVDRLCDVDHVSVAPESATVFAGDQTQFMAFPFSKEGWPLKYPLEWAVSRADLATITFNSNFTNLATAIGRAEGETQINVDIAAVIMASSTLKVLPALIAPKIIRTEPSNNEQDVCTNALVLMDIDQQLDSKTVNTDTLSIDAISGASNAQVATTSLNDYGSWIVENNAYNNTSRIKFILKQPLPDAQKIQIQIKDGILGQNGKALDRGDFAQFSFITDKLCQLNFVKVTANENNDASEWTFSSLTDDASDNDPASAAFDSVRTDRDKKFMAAGYEIGGQILTPLPAYFWKWKWDSDNRDIASVIYAADEVSVIAAQKKNGAAKITVTAQFGSVEKAAGAKDLIGEGKAIVDVCLNRWDPKEDKSDLWIDARFNYSLSYCRDYGVADDRADDLPALELDSQAKGVNTGKFALFKEYLWRVPTTNDIIGVRIYDNPQGLTPADWFKAQGLTGNPQTVTVDGYSAITEGRTLYVGATNFLYNNVGALTGDVNNFNEGINNFNEGNQNQARLWLNNLLLVIKNLWAKIINYAHASPAPDPDNLSGVTVNNFIFLISYNQDADPKTAEIVRRLEDRLAFNVNLNNDPDLKGKIQRDARRLSDIGQMMAALDNYKTAHGSYPSLVSGSYVKGESFSLWPSWNKEFGAAVGYAPVDPKNQFSACLKCAAPELKNGGFEIDGGWGQTGQGNIIDNSDSNNKNFIHEGNKALAVKVSNGYEFIVAQYVSLAADVSYEATAWVYIVSGRAQLQLGGSTLGNEWLSPSDYTGWYQLKSRFSPAISGPVLLAIGNFNKQAAQFVVDDVQLKLVDERCGYDSQTCWNPTANNGTGSFACSANDSYFYNYQAKGGNYLLSARLEAADAGKWTSWWNSLNSAQQSRLSLYAKPLTDLCTSAAQAGWCGDGLVSDGEQCEPGQFYDPCNIYQQNPVKWYNLDLIGCTNECKWDSKKNYYDFSPDTSCGGYCGDGILNPGEECDASSKNLINGEIFNGFGGGTGINDQYACSATCRDLGGWYGDGIIQFQYGEQCEAGQPIIGYDCPPNSKGEKQLPSCNNGKIKCSTGNHYQGRCGNNIVEGSEQCDICSPFNTDECDSTIRLSTSTDPFIIRFKESQQYKCDVNTCKFYGGYCGDHTWNKDFEGCDISNQGNPTFENNGYGGGISAIDQYSCDKDKCQDTGGWCGDGIWQNRLNGKNYTAKNFEVCDASVKNGLKGFGGGTSNTDQYGCSQDCQKTEDGWCGNLKVESAYEQFDYNKNGSKWIITGSGTSIKQEEGTWDCLGSGIAFQNKLDENQDDVNGKKRGVYDYKTCKIKCYGNQKPYQGLCGNDKIEDPETCELNNKSRMGILNSATDLNLKDWSCFIGENIQSGKHVKYDSTLSCNGCQAVCNNNSKAIAYQGICGDGKIEWPEECDPQGETPQAKFGGDSCEARGAKGGELSCNADCTVNTDGCLVNLPTCGNGVKEPGEECDGNDFGGITSCTDLIYDLKTKSKYQYPLDPYKPLCNLNCQASCYNYNCQLLSHFDQNNPCARNDDGTLKCYNDYGNCDERQQNGCEVDLKNGVYAGIMLNLKKYGDWWKNGTIGDADIWNRTYWDKRVYDYYKAEPAYCGDCEYRLINATCNDGQFVCKDGYANCDGDLKNGCESKISQEALDSNNFNCAKGKITCNKNYESCATQVFDSTYLASNAINIWKKVITCPSQDCENALVNVLAADKTLEPYKGKGLFNGCSAKKDNECCGVALTANTNIQCQFNPQTNYSAIVCESGFGNCNKKLNDGCEINLTSDKNNCGNCDTVCNDRNQPFTEYGKCVNSVCKWSRF